MFLHSRDSSVGPATRPGLANAAAEVAVDAPTYSQILKSSALMGGSAAINIAIGIVRTKAMAVLLGPTGLGLMGFYTLILETAMAIAAMGLRNSGVRQIADAASSGDNARVVRTIVVLRRVSLGLGIIGALTVAILATPLSILTFRNAEHSFDIALLSLAVLFGVIASGQGALIQGMRRIHVLAKMSVLGALFGTLISVPTVYVLGMAGVAPALVAIAAVSIATAWWYSRELQVPRIKVGFGECRHEVALLLRLGFAFMASAFLMSGASYAVRVIVARQLGLDAAGLYQAAWALGGIYVGFILQAMSSDFYPRLVGVSSDNARCNKLVNEQAQVGLLLVGPGILGTLVLAPTVLYFLYSREFIAATDLLRWLCLGMTLRVITWPMGFIIVAKDRKALFLGVELVWAIANVALTWVCVTQMGLEGAGAAFFGSYVIHGLTVYLVVRRISGFRWSLANWKAAGLLALSISLVFVCFATLPSLQATAIGGSIWVVSTYFSIRALCVLVCQDNLPRPLRRLLSALRLAPAEVKSG
jgi:antigen flippase